MNVNKNSNSLDWRRPGGCGFSYRFFEEPCMSLPCEAASDGCDRGNVWGLQGIAGKSLQEIETLGFPALEDGTTL